MFGLADLPTDICLAFLSQDGHTALMVACTKSPAVALAMLNHPCLTAECLNQISDVRLLLSFNSPVLVSTSLFQDGTNALLTVCKSQSMLNVVLALLKDPRLTAASLNYINPVCLSAFNFFCVFLRPVPFFQLGMSALKITCFLDGLEEIAMAIIQDPRLTPECLNHIDKV